MTTPNMPSRNPRSVLPKDNNGRHGATSPPPAYTPGRHPNIAAFMARDLPLFRGGPRPSTLQILRQAEQAYATPLDSVDDEEQDEETDPSASSPISLRINTSISINRGNNIVCLASNPTDDANAIANAVVKALQEGSAGRCGIPMIDENGAPRPLKIEVDAGMVIEGADNIVGSKEFIIEVLKNSRRGFSSRRPRQESREEDDGDDEEEEQIQPRKRQRSSL